MALSGQLTISSLIKCLTDKVRDVGDCPIFIVDADTQRKVFLKEKHFQVRDGNIFIRIDYDDEYQD